MSRFVRFTRLMGWSGLVCLVCAWSCGSDTDKNNGQDLNNLFGDVDVPTPDTGSDQVQQDVLVPPDQAESDQANHQILDDTDKDGIPDPFDLFPEDPTAPGHVLQNAVYAHTADELWLMQVKTYEMDFVAFFSWPEDTDNNPHKMTDIAIDRYGVLYGVSYSGLYVVNANTGECYRVGTLPEPFNALTLVPKGVLDPKDVLVGISGVGGWYRLTAQGNEFFAEQLGSYGEGYMSSGDAYSIEKVGTFASVNKTGVANDYLVEVDPKTGAVVREVGEMTGLSLVYGLAGWTGRAMAFDESGKISIVDTKTGEVLKTITTVPKKWWGAGVQTVIPEE